MEGKSSIPILFSKDIHVGIDRVSIADGITEGKNDSRYVDGSIVPRMPFKAIGQSSLDKLTQVSHTPNTKEYIAVIPLKGIYEEMLEFGIPNVGSSEQLQLLLRKNEYLHILNSTLKGLEKVTRIEGDIQILGISFKEPNQITATVDHNIERHIGLHLDSWDRTSLNLRAQSRNRLCVNVGLEDRFLLFVRKTINEMLEDLDADPLRIGGSDLGRMYLRKYPDTNVIKIRVKPGEAYIAPTENLIHDSTTFGKTKPDLALTFLGHFYFKR